MMDQPKKTHLRLVADNTGPQGLDSVAAAIRPLPREVEPSQEFLGELRTRLLKLEPGRKPRGGDSRRAA
jgi:hypothetical protein